MGGGGGLSDEWVESKEEVSEGVRNAVALAMKAASADEEKEKKDNAEAGENSGEYEQWIKTGQPG